MLLRQLFALLVKQMFLDNHSLGPNDLETARLKRAAQGLPIIDLTSANPTAHGYLFPRELLEKASASYWHNRLYRPDPNGAEPARSAIVTYYRQRRLYEVDASALFLTASTSESYGLLFSLLAEAGDNVLGPDLCYPLFELLAASHGVEIKPYRMSEARGEWRIDYEDLERQIDERTRAILFISPHNPAGNVIAEACPALSRAGLPLIFDEVFAEFTDESPTPAGGSLYPDLPVFHLNGISKMLALPDLKLGWIAANGKAFDCFGERLAILNDCYLGASSLIQHMLPVLLSEGLQFSRVMTGSIRSTVRWLASELNSIDGLECPLPPGGAFVFPRVDTGEDEESLALRLLDKGVLVHPGFFYGASEGVHFVISCVPGQDEIRPALERISGVIREACF